MNRLWLVHWFAVKFMSSRDHPGSVGSLVIFPKKKGQRFDAPGETQHLLEYRKPFGSAFENIRDFSEQKRPRKTDSFVWTLLRQRVPWVGGCCRPCVKELLVKRSPQRWSLAGHGWTGARSPARWLRENHRKDV